MAAGTEIVTYIEVETAKDVIGSKARFTIIIGTHDGRGTGIPAIIVIDEGETSDTVDIEVVDVETCLILVGRLTA